MLIGSIATGVIAYFLNSYYTGKILKYNSWMQIKDISFSFLLATLIASSVYFLKFLPFHSGYILCLQILTGLVVFVIVCKLVQPMEYVEIRTLGIKIIEKIKRK